MSLVFASLLNVFLIVDVMVAAAFHWNGCFNRSLKSYFSIMALRSSRSGLQTSEAR